MPEQIASNFYVNQKVEATYNTAPGATGATRLRIIDSPGFDLEMALLKSSERRGDMLDTMARMGSRRAPGTFNAEMIVGAHDLTYEALWRATFVPAVAITVDGGAALTSFTVNSTSTFTLAGTTTPIVAGFRVGDVGRFTNMSTAANNNINIRIKSIVGGLVTVHGTPLTVQSADTAATFTIAKKLSNPTTPVERTFYIDQYYRGSDVSAVIGGAKWVGWDLSGEPDGLNKSVFTALAASVTELASASSPYFTSETVPTGDPLVFADASISLGGTDIVNVTAFNLKYQIVANTQGVNGSSTSPSIYANKASLEGSLSMTMNDLAKLTAYRAETEFELHVMFVEPESEPKDFIAIFVPRIKLTRGGLPQLGGDGAAIIQLPFTCGVKEGAAATGYDTTLFNLLTSAA